MHNAYRFELKKSIHSKMLYICAGLILGLNILEWAIKNFLAPAEVAAELSNGAAHLGAYVNGWLIELTRGGFFIMLMLALAVVMTTEEYSKGLFKATLTMVSRRQMAAGKLLAMMTLSGFWVLVAFISAGIAGFFGYSLPVAGMGDTLWVALGCWLVANAFGMVYMFIFIHLEKPLAAVGLGFLLYIVLSFAQMLVGANYLPFLIGSVTHLLSQVTLGHLMVVYGNALVYGVVAGLLFVLALNKKEILL